MRPTTTMLPAALQKGMHGAMSAHDIQFKDLLFNLYRGACPPDLDTEWDAESEAFKPVVRVPQPDGTWRTFNMDWFRKDPTDTQPTARHAQN
jgi:hypothetical protein